ncbi:hypothetical protein Leryth_003998 [Lithospermum erythrorhizon]|nr:hypothetical protein Leryth_003998 [Lithospermum erythrorhizon]
MGSYDLLPIRRRLAKLFKCMSKVTISNVRTNASTKFATHFGFVKHLSDSFGSTRNKHTFFSTLGAPRLFAGRFISRPTQRLSAIVTRIRRSFMACIPISILIFSSPNPLIRKPQWTPSTTIPIVWVHISFIETTIIHKIHHNTASRSDNIENEFFFGWGGGGILINYFNGNIVTTS